jgi:hypothetical protein
MNSRFERVSKVNLYFLLTWVCTQEVINMDFVQRCGEKSTISHSKVEVP